MLQLTVPASEFYDESTGCFVNTKMCTLHLEHSLAAISKWESKWHKPFLSSEAKTETETMDYIRCMTLNPNVPPETYYALNTDDIRVINFYMEDSMTASWFSGEVSSKGKGGRETITAEIIYYWMIQLDIPFSCEKWHLNRLLTLIRVCNAKNSPSRKMSKSEIKSMYRTLNASRRQQLNSKG